MKSKGQHCKYCGQVIRDMTIAIEVDNNFFCDSVCQESNRAFEDHTNSLIFEDTQADFPEDCGL